MTADDAIETGIAALLILAGIVAIWGEMLR